LLHNKYRHRYCCLWRLLDTKELLVPRVKMQNKKPEKSRWRVMPRVREKGGRCSKKKVEIHGGMAESR
jgi:hypothetical protein